MRTLEASGRSVDEAIFNGLNELGISIDEVEIEIVRQESKGILGIGAKPAIVRLIEREMVVPEYMNEPIDRSMAPRRDDRPARGDRSRSDRGDRTRSAGGDNRNRSRARQNDRRRDDEPREAREPREPRADQPEVPYTREAAENDAAAVFLKGMLDKMGVEAEVLAFTDENGVKLRIDSATMGMLIGHRGETLDAMQYLTSLCINRNRKEEGYTRVTLDTEGYRGKREETLTRLARKIASQVRSSGRPRTLEPMNPYERRVLHATLQNNPYVTTHSEGEEPNRRVVIEPRKDAKPPREDNRQTRESAGAKEKEE